MEKDSKENQIIFSNLLWNAQKIQMDGGRISCSENINDIKWKITTL